MITIGSETLAKLVADNEGVDQERLGVRRVNQGGLCLSPCKRLGRGGARGADIPAWRSSKFNEKRNAEFGYTGWMAIAVSDNGGNDRPQNPAQHLNRMFTGRCGPQY